MMYSVLEPIRIKKQGQEIELKAGQTIILPEDKATLLLKQGRIRPINEPTDCFDPDGLLNEVIGFWQGKQDGEAQCIDHIDTMIQDGMLKPPYGFKVKNSPVIGGDYWIVSCNEAREKIPSEAMSFTTTELKPIVEACKVFNGKVVEIKKLQTKQVANGS